MEEKKELHQPDNPQKRIKDCQMLVAQAMKLPTEIIELVKDDTLTYQVREWLFMAAKMGMPPEQIKPLKGRTLQQIHVGLMDYLKEKLGSTDPLNQLVEKELATMREVVEENRSLRKILTENIERSARQQQKMLEDKLQDREKQIEQLQVHLQQKNSEENIVPNFGTRDEADKPSLFYKMRELFGANKREFCAIEAYIKNINMNDAQKNFILDAWDEGMPVKDISSFADPYLSVDIMKRIKEAIQRRKK